MQALSETKIRLLNLCMHHFSYCGRLIHLKRHLKRSSCIVFKNIRCALFHWGNHFRNLKLACQIWTSSNVSVVSDYFIWKNIWKGIIVCCLKKIGLIDFLRYALLKSKIGLPNLDFSEIFCGKRLIHSDWHVKRYLFIKFEENR